MNKIKQGLKMLITQIPTPYQKLIRKMQLKMNMSPGTHKFLFLVLFIFFSFSIKSEPIPGQVVVFQILDKITTKVMNFEVPVSDNVNFESLIIEIYACHTNPPEEIPEDFVLLKIFDNIDVENSKLIYQGWMISSSPAATPLEHPLYDLWLKDCKIDTDF